MTNSCHRGRLTARRQTVFSNRLASFQVLGKDAIVGIITKEVGNNLMISEMSALGSQS